MSLSLLVITSHASIYYIRTSYAMSGTCPFISIRYPPRNKINSFDAAKCVVGLDKGGCVHAGNIFKG